MIANETGGTLDASILWDDPYVQATKERSERCSFAADGEETATVWFGQPPRTFLVRATSGSRTWERTFTAQEFTNHYRRGFLSTSPPRLTIRAGTISFLE